MKIKNRDLFRLSAGLAACKDLRGVKFAYACAKNLRKVNALCEDLRAGVSKNKAVQEFEAKKSALLTEHAQDMAAAVAAVKALADASPEAVAALEEFERLLAEDSDVDIYTIAQDLIPADISAGELDGIMEMIAE
jgi:hypothetical protein